MLTTEANIISVITELGILTEKQINDALATRTDLHENIGRFLTRTGVISEREHARCIGVQHGIQFIDLAKTQIDPKIARLITREIALRYKAIPIGNSLNAIKIAMANPLDVHAVDNIGRIINAELMVMIATEEDILATITRCLTADEDVGDIIGKAINDSDTDSRARDGEPEERISSIIDLNDVIDDAPVVRLVNAMITRAISERASDIHIEPQPAKVRVRIRVDGILQEIMTVPNDLKATVVSRVKVMAGMDVAEKRAPQDGRATLIVTPNEYDLRISTYPSVHGENVVIRVLEKSASEISLDRLGLQSDTASDFSRMVQMPYGLILACGPTGSGKTTSLYAALNTINTVERNIISIEDPVEYQLTGAVQGNVNRKAGLTFAKGLRTIVRQDPDVIFVGEIRDSETAEISVEAALTGHLVMSTLHASDAAGAITRLLDMQMEPFLVASSAIGFLAQRLLRKVCQRCAVPLEIGDDLLSELKLPVKSEDLRHAVKGCGCEFCRHTGYQGRTGIYELLRVDDEIRSAIISRRSTAEIRQMALAKGMRSLREDAILKLKNGQTTIEEVIRATTE